MKCIYCIIAFIKVLNYVQIMLYYQKNALDSVHTELLAITSADIAKNVYSTRFYLASLKFSVNGPKGSLAPPSRSITAFGK